MTDETHVTFRSDRRPGYCWQENELYDAFQPVIGAIPTLVYARMTRDCADVGAEMSFSLRELARACGVSKDSVQRALQVIEHLGMVQVDRHGDKRPATYRLRDLKDRVCDLGGAYDRKTHTIALPGEVAAKLKAEVKALIRIAQRKKPPVENLSLRATDCPVENVEAVRSSVAQSDRSVSVSDRSVALSDTHLLIGKRKTLDNHPLPPPQADGVENPDLETPEKQPQPQKQKQKPSPPRQEQKEQPQPQRQKQEQRPAALTTVAEAVGTGANDFLLRPVRAIWTGVSGELDKHLLHNAPAPHLGDGFDDWQRYRFRDLAIADAVIERDGGESRQVLFVSSPDPPATAEGLKKYKPTVDRLLAKWYGGPVELRVCEQARSA